VLYLVITLACFDIDVYGKKRSSSSFSKGIPEKNTDPNIGSMIDT